MCSFIFKISLKKLIKYYRKYLIKVGLLRGIIYGDVTTAPFWNHSGFQKTGPRAKFSITQNVQNEEEKFVEIKLVNIY